MALHQEQRAVFYDANDSFCINGQPLVEISRIGQTVEFRTYPDTQVKIMGHVLDDGPAYFEAWFPSGDRIDYGKTHETRPMAATGVPRAWLAGERRDARGNAIQYDWCFAEDESGYTAEYALISARYSALEGADAERAVAFVYKTRDDVQTTYSRGMALQHSLQLSEIQSFGPNEQLAFRYTFAYDKSESTGRTLLQSVQQCGGDGTCLAPTMFHYAKAQLGFDDVVTDIDAPLSDKASPMLFDVDHDGLPEYVVGDSTPSSTLSNPITEWRIAKNTGGAFAPENVALLQEWSFVQNADGPSDPTLMQPELGTSIQFNDDAIGDLMLHDISGSQANHTMLIGKADLTFAFFDTGIRRPFPLQQSPKGLRNGAGAVHLADCDGDSKPDLIQCTDKGDTLDTALFSTWKLHVWRPSGFTPDGEIIDTLTGIPCGVELYTVDANRDSVTDLIATGYLLQGGAPIEPSGTYDVHRRRSNGTWEVFDTGLVTSQSGQRPVFVDANGDGLLDVIRPRTSDGRLLTWINTGLGFADKPIESLVWDGSVAQSKYFHLAQSLDFDGDSKTDVLVPMVDAISPNIPRWVILRSTSGTLEQIDAGIPFDAVLGDVVDIADPRGPRITDVDGNGSADVAIFLNNKLHIFNNRAVDPDVLVGFSDGSNDHDPDEAGFVPNVSIKYGHLIDESKAKGQPAKDEDFYISQSDPANGCTYPRVCAVGPRGVVRGYEVNDGQGGVRRFELRYRDGRSDRLHGSLGFGKRILVDLDTGATTATFYDNVTKLKLGARDVYPFAGQTTQQWRWVPGLVTQPNPDQIEMAFTDRTLEVVPTNSGQTYFTLATQTHTRRMQGSFSGAGSLEAYVGLVETLENVTMLGESTVEALAFDEFHNMLEVEASTIGVDATFHITRTVKNDVNKWMLGLPDSQTECSTGSGLKRCRVVKRTTNEFGEVDSEETSSSDGIDDTKLKAVYERDKFGNITLTTATDAFGHKRESTRVYDEGLFPIKHVNALNHETMQEFDPVLGVLKKQTDPNGLATEWGYDSLGRLESESLSDGSSTKTVTTREKIDGVWRLKERTTTTGGGDDETIVDNLGRPIRRFTHGPAVKANTPRVMQVIEYDPLSGNVARKSVPTSEGTPATSLKFDEYKFDALGREIRRVTPWNAVTTTSYNGLVVDVTDPLLKHTITQIDTLGRPATITDAANGLTKYKYGPFDALYTVTDPGNSMTRWTRDAFGRPTKIEEPDRGATTLKHNGFGDLMSSTDALGRTFTMEMDGLGRTTSRVDKLGAQVLTTTWTWDIAPHGIGRLFSVVSPDGVKSYGYNKRGQTESIHLGVANDIFAARLQYDGVGRVKTLDYPQPLGGEPFGVAYDYDAHGFRTAVRDNVTKDAFWELKDVDNAGRYKEELFGNGAKTVRGYHDDKQALKSITTTLGASTIQQLSYEWDSRLNLKSRTDAFQPQNKTERFKVDALDRLTCAYFGLVENANAACHTSYAYAANGNVVDKSEVGTLLYMDPAHPHAVTNAPGETFGYDAIGNQITRPGGVVITYTPFDLPRTITKGGQTTTFGYDGDEQRIRKTTANSETIYFEDLYERIENKANGVMEHRYSVHSPERTVAIVTRGGNEPGTKYLHVDHLGSTETITNEGGVQVEKRSYDAFGGRRNPQWGAPAGILTSKTKQGFTGHDEEDEFGLVNMKGRLLDPRIGRFTTTDPVITNIFDGQAFNKYAYVNNNPLTLVDPTGFAPDTTIPIINDAIEQTVISQYPDDFVPEPIPDETNDVLESTNSLRFTTDVGTMGDGGAQESQGVDRREQIADLEGGYLFGVLEGLTPFAAVGHSLADAFGLSDNKSREARIGLAIGQIVGGVIATVGGIGGEVLGGAATVTGVGAAVGVPVMVVSAVAVAGGIGNIAAGIRGLASVMSGGGGTRAPTPAQNRSNEPSREAQRGIRSLEKRIAEHEKKLTDFRSNPTVRPGMEGQRREVIEAAQQTRIRHLEKEIETFKQNIEKLKGGR